MMKHIGLRVDVDFEVGLVKGVPNIADVLQSRGILATFYVTMGPDGFRHSGKRVRSRSYVKRIMSFNPVRIASRFGPAYLARQFLGRAGHVGRDHPDILRRLLEGGHEVAPHGYDHFWWAENIWNCGEEEVGAEMSRTVEAFTEATGRAPEVWASPNWRCNEYSLRLIEQYGFRYGADCRGISPFRPKLGAWRAGLVQLPITMPCLHEIKAYLDRPDPRATVHELLSHATDGYNVWCIHGYYEGLLERDLFARALDGLLARGYDVVPMNALLDGAERAGPPVCDLGSKTVPGGRGEVSFQMAGNT